MSDERSEPETEAVILHVPVETLRTLDRWLTQRRAELPASSSWSKSFASRPTTGRSCQASPTKPRRPCCSSTVGSRTERSALIVTSRYSVGAVASSTRANRRQDSTPCCSALGRA